MAMDALGTFGAISLATVNVDVFSAHSLDLDVIDSRATRFPTHRPGVGGRELAVVFMADADFAAIDSFTPFIQDSADAATWAKIYIGPKTADGFPKKGIAAVLNVPRECRRHIRVGATPGSTGVFTAKTMKADLEHGPNQS